MTKQQSSRLINLLTGGDKTEMFCARVYVQQKLYGGFWLPLGKLIDIGFLVIRKQQKHVRATYLLERRTNAKSNKDTTSIS